VTVNPGTLASLARIPEHPQDGTTRHPSVAVFSERGVEPADPCSPRDRVKAQGPDALGVVAVDGVAHRLFVVESIVAGRGSATHPEHQVGNCVGVAIGAAPTDGGAFIGAHPDHAGLTPELSDAVGMVDGLCPPASVLIELGPVGGLNGEGHLGSFGMKPL
jgi:hypothetical protein